MIEPNQAAYIVKVTRADADMPNGVLTMLYAVLTENPEKAAELTQHAVKADAEVEVLEARLSQDTAQAIGLMPDYARHYDQCTIQRRVYGQIKSRPKRLERVMNSSSVVRLV